MPRLGAAFDAGQAVQLPGGGLGTVVRQDRGLVLVRLDGETTGWYPAELLRAADKEA